MQNKAIVPNDANCKVEFGPVELPRRNRNLHLRVKHDGCGGRVSCGVEQLHAQGILPGRQIRRDQQAMMTAKDLADAPLSDVISVNQGHGPRNMCRLPILCQPKKSSCKAGRAIVDFLPGPVELQLIADGGRIRQLRRMDQESRSRAFVKYGQIIRIIFPFDRSVPNRRERVLDILRIARQVDHA